MRLYMFYEQMRRIHQDYFPDWRFGQLMCNFLGWMWQEKKRDPFFPEEDEIIGLLEEYGGATSQWSKEKK